jgi:hypothetical protein
LPAAWDEHGNVKGISINTNYEKEYLVEPNITGNELLKYIHEKVAIKGKIRERLDGRLHISVRSYQTLENHTDNNLS